MDVPEAGLPVKYLGVLSISTKLRYSDCLALKDRMLKRVLSWSNKLLSYGGRSQLISSVLFSIQVYWSSIFIIPHKMMMEIEGILNAFLWNGVELKTAGVKVSWNAVCVPKSEGGLGFKRLNEWNIASMLRHLWALCKKEDILWVKWVHSNVIKNQFIWHMRLPSDSSWTLRKIFSLRLQGQRFIKSVIGNGQTTFLWLDNWHTLGPLFQKFGNRVVFNLGRSLCAKVSSIIVNGRWRWPRGRNATINEIIAATDGDLLPQVAQEDRVVWTLNPTGNYSAKSAWLALRSSSPVVDWHALVWHKRYVPRWSFILWVAILRRLSIKDRLFSWGITTDCNCVLCHGGIESHDHLFFGCSFSTLVWNEVKACCGYWGWFWDSRV